MRSLLIAFAATLALSTAVKAQDVTVAVTAIVEHPALDAARDGVKEALATAGYKEGENLKFVYQSAQGNPATAAQIARQFAGDGPDVIVPISTPSAQAAVSATRDIPIVFTAVTDPVAAKLTPSWDEGGDGITGSSDLQDVAAVMTFTKKLLPNAKRFGLPYNPGEANDVALLEKVKEAAPGAGFEVVEVGVDNVNDIQQRIASLAGKADVIYTPASNLLQPAIAAVSAAARQAGIPIVNSDDGAVRDGVVPASFAVNYIQVGENAGKIAAQILKGADPKTIAPARPAYEDHSPLISKKVAKEFGIEIPASLDDCNCFVD